MVIKRKIEKYGRDIFISYVADRPVFKDMKKYNIKDYAYMNLFNVVDEDFLRENNIEYIKDDEKIIPIGLIEFQRIRRDEYCSYSLDLMIDVANDLYKVADIFESIKEAIKIKEKYYDFVELVNKNESIIWSRESI